MKDIITAIVKKHQILATGFHVKTSRDDEIVEKLSGMVRDSAQCRPKEVIAFAGWFSDMQRGILLTESTLFSTENFPLKYEDIAGMMSRENMIVVADSNKKQRNIYCEGLGYNLFSILMDIYDARKRYYKDGESKSSIIAGYKPARSKNEKPDYNAITKPLGKANIITPKKFIPSHADSVGITVSPVPAYLQIKGGYMPGADKDKIFDSMVEYSQKENVHQPKYILKCLYGYLDVKNYSNRFDPDESRKYYNMLVNKYNEGKLNWDDPTGYTKDKLARLDRYIEDCRKLYSDESDYSMPKASVHKRIVVTGAEESGKSTVMAAVNYALYGKYTYSKLKNAATPLFTSSNSIRFASMAVTYEGVNYDFLEIGALHGQEPDVIAIAKQLKSIGVDGYILVIDSYKGFTVQTKDYIRAMAERGIECMAVVHNLKYAIETAVNEHLQKMYDSFELFGQDAPQVYKENFGMMTSENSCVKLVDDVHKKIIRNHLNSKR